MLWTSRIDSSQYEQWEKDSLLPRCSVVRQFCELATDVTAGTPVKVVEIEAPLPLAGLERVNVLVPAPETTVVPAGKFALTMPTLAFPTS
jgi:hypothetical protein